MKSEIKNLVLFALISIAIVSCTTKAEENSKQEEAVLVKTVKVDELVVANPVHSSGRLSAKSEAKLSFKTGGIIQHILVDEGQIVKKGQLLAKVKPEEIEANMRKAKLGLEKSLRDYERIENLYNDSVATLEQLQDVKTALDMARSNFEIANFNLQHSEIIAPSNGKILKRLADKNEMIKSGASVFIFASTDNAWVIRTNITDKDVFKLKLKDKAEVNFDAYRNETFTAHVSEIGYSADPYTGTYEVELTLENNNKKLASGLISTIDIFPNTKEKRPVIPIGALVNGNEYGGNVYKVTQNNRVKKTEVEISGIDQNYFVIKSGIKKGDEIVSVGTAYLKDNTLIKAETNPDKIADNL